MWGIEVVRRALTVLAAIGLLCAAGCRKEEEPPVVRPVLSMVVQSAPEGQLGFAGTIQPRFSTDLGFQTGGQIISFGLDVGDLVKKGQTLAKLDPTNLDAQVNSGKADVAKAQSQLENAQAAEGRIAILLKQKVSSQSDFDSAQQQREKAAADLKSAQASLVKAQEQRRYADLTSDMEGVITGKNAQVGQTVSAGQKILTVARTDTREAVVDLPQDLTSSLAVGQSFTVRLQAAAAMSTTAKVREIAPQADTATRLYRVRLTLDKIPEPFRLGSTVRVFELAAPQAAIELPRTAILERDGKTLVWVVDTQAKTVGTVPVTLAGEDGQNVRLAGGIDTGARVVTAGIHSLTEGQTIKIEAEAGQ